MRANKGEDVDGKWMSVIICIKIERGGSCEELDSCGIPVANGLVNSGIANAFGFAGSKNYALVVTNGATVAITAATGKLGSRTVKIAGTGVEGLGAFEVGSFVTTDGSFLVNVTLLDDATFSVKKSGLFFLHYGYLDLAGHTMSLIGGGEFVDMYSNISTNGDIAISGTTFNVRSWNSTTDVNRSVKDAPDMSFSLNGNATLKFYNRGGFFTRKLHVRGTGNWLVHQEQYTNIPVDRTRDHEDWKGPIVFNPDDDAADPAELTVWVEKDLCGFALFSPYNGNAALVLASPSSVPDPTLFSRTDGHVVYSADAGAWPMSDVLDFVEAAGLSSLAIRFDADATDGPGQVSLAGAQIGGRSMAVNGQNPVVFSGGATEALPLNFVWTSGLGVLSGTSPYYAYRINVNTSAGSDFATALVVDGADVTVASPEGFIGTGVGGTAANTSRLVITNSLVRSADPSVKDAFNAAYPAYGTISNSLVVGRAAHGLLEIEDGAVITNRLQVGMHGSAVWDSVSYGGVRQRGGQLVAVDPQGNCLKGSALGVGQTSGGYYELQGGELLAHGYFSVGAGGVGTMLVSGGRFAMTNVLGGTSVGLLEVGSFNGGRGALRVSGGTVDFGSRDSVIHGRGATSGATQNSITVDGADAEVDCHRTAQYFGYGNTSSVMTYNFNGGVFRSGTLVKHTNGNHHLSNREYVNFNGGTFRAGASGYLFGDADLTHGADAVVVYAGGATIDTDGHDCAVNQPIRAATGKGIGSIVLAKPITHVISPLVEIVSTNELGESVGCGASAFAHYDWETHTIDRIDVTSAGVGYEEGFAKVILRYHPSGASETAATVAELVDNDSTGSFTKAGEGTLDLHSTNTWGGATVLAGGKLQCLCDCAIPTNTTVVLAGGVLNMNGKLMENGDAAPKKWAVDADRAKELGGAIPYAGAIEFLEGATLEIRNAAEMDEDGEALVLLETTGGVIGRPEIVGTVDPEWHLRFSAKKIVLAPNRGTMLIVR